MKTYEEEGQVEVRERCPREYQLNRVIDKLDLHTETHAVPSENLIVSDKLANAPVARSS